MMNRRRAIMAAGGGSTARLPAEFQEVEYIDTDNKCVVNTGFSTFNSRLGFDCVVQPLRTLNANNENIVFSNNTQSRGILKFTNKVVWETAYGTQNEITASGLVKYTLSGASYNGGYFTANGTTISLTNGTSNGEITLFQDTLVSTKHGQLRVWSIKLYSGSARTIKRDFVPCYRKADNVIGLYDLVTDTFYTNSGAGSFTKGPDV